MRIWLASVPGSWKGDSLSLEHHSLMSLSITAEFMLMRRCYMGAWERPNMWLEGQDFQPGDKSLTSVGLGEAGDKVRSCGQGISQSCLCKQNPSRKFGHQSSVELPSQTDDVLGGDGPWLHRQKARKLCVWDPVRPCPIFGWSSCASFITKL